MQLGQWQIDAVDAGRFRIDGGVMYGVVPKVLWEKIAPPDEQNRVCATMRCVLARDGNHTVLIDAGQGDKLSPLDRSAHAIESAPALLASLETLGVGVDDVDIVVLSHLHWDHAGGATTFDSNRQPVPAFPRATYWVNCLEWADAISGAAELAGSYETKDFVPLAHSGQLSLAEGDQQIAPGLSVCLTGGHTRGHQAVLLQSGGMAALFPGDICPTAHHLRPLWCTAYDLYPVETRHCKARLLGTAADEGWWVLWGHDPHMAACRLDRHPKSGLVVRDARPDF